MENQNYDERVPVIDTGIDIIINIFKKCSKCDKIVQSVKSNIDPLSVHQNTNVQDQPYMCNQCNTNDSQNNSLNIHRNSYTVAKYSCNYCNQTFSIKRKYLTHMRIHTDVRPYDCSECEKKFIQKAHLKVHMRIHTGDRPFQCTVCEKAFSQKSILTVHMRLHTG